MSPIIMNVNSSNQFSYSSGEKMGGGGKLSQNSDKESNISDSVSQKKHIKDTVTLQTKNETFSKGMLEQVKIRASQLKMEAASLKQLINNSPDESLPSLSRQLKQIVKELNLLINKYKTLSGKQNQINMPSNSADSSSEPVNEKHASKNQSQSVKGSDVLKYDKSPVDDLSLLFKEIVKEIKEIANLLKKRVALMQSKKDKKVVMKQLQEIDQSTRVIENEFKDFNKTEGMQKNNFGTIAISATTTQSIKDIGSFEPINIE